MCGEIAVSFTRDCVSMGSVSCSRETVALRLPGGNGRPAGWSGRRKAKWRASWKSSLMKRIPILAVFPGGEFAVANYNLMAWSRIPRAAVSQRESSI
jgi:hypothetical protein